MNQATKTQIENEAAELYPTTFIFDGVLTDNTLYNLERKCYIAGATKYAELLEQEKAKGEKLAEALEIVNLKLPLMRIAVDIDVDKEEVIKNVRFLEGQIEKALTEYKK